MASLVAELRVVQVGDVGAGRCGTRRCRPAGRGPSRATADQLAGAVAGLDGDPGAFPQRVDLAGELGDPVTGPGDTARSPAVVRSRPPSSAASTSPSMNVSRSSSSAWSRASMASVADIGDLLVNSRNGDCTFRAPATSLRPIRRLWPLALAVSSTAWQVTGRSHPARSKHRPADLVQVRGRRRRRRRRRRRCGRRAPWRPA